MSNKAPVFSLDKKFLKFKKRIESTAKRILKILKKSNISVEIYLAGNSKMKFLNKKFRGKNKTTTVLSFNEPRNFIYPHTKRGLVPSARRYRLSSLGAGVYPKSKFRPIGEIYIKFPITNYPITQLLCHGLLHLLGYNHQKKSDRIKMESLENLVIRELGN